MRLYLHYQIIIARRAQKVIDTLDIIDRTKVALKINNLTTESIKTLNIKKLQCYKDLYRLKVDNFRIIYKVDNSGKLLIVGAIGPRKDIYSVLQRISF